MRFFLAFVLLIAGSSALPQDQVAFHQERFVSDTIIGVIEDMSQLIKDAGFDPLNIKREVFSYALPVPVIFNAAAFIDDLLSTGLSNIVVNRMNYGLLTSRLNFDIELPHIHFSLADAVGEVTLFDNTVVAEVSGSLDIRRIRAIGEVRVNVGIISGISVSRVDMDFTLTGIDSNVNLIIQGDNYSAPLNKFLGSTITDTLTEFKRDIDLLIEIVMLQVINDNL